MFSKMIKISMVIMIMLVCFSGTVWSGSDGSSNAIGLRLGYGIDPDQFVVGAQGMYGKVLNTFKFAPSIDAGFGDNAKTIIFNADLRLLALSPPNSSSGFYAGFGPALAWLDHDNAGSDTEIGLNVFAGIKLPMGNSNSYNLEGRLGVADMPDFRILVGIFFGGSDNRSGK